MAEEREQEENEGRRRSQQQKEEAREREATRAVWMQEQREWNAMHMRQQHRNVEHTSMSERLVDLFERWKVGCNVCRVNGRIVGRKGWRICGCTSEEMASKSTRHVIG